MDLSDIAKLVGIIVGSLAALKTMHDYLIARRKTREQKQALINSLAGPASDEEKLNVARMMRYARRVERFGLPWTTAPISDAT